MTRVRLSTIINLIRQTLEVGSTAEAIELWNAFHAPSLPLDGEPPPQLQKQFISPQTLLVPIGELEWSVRTENVLNAAGIERLGDLVVLTESQLLRFSNLGRKSLNEIREVVASFKLHLGMHIANWPLSEGGLIEDVELISDRVRSIAQERLGTTFQPGDETLQIHFEISPTDEAAAQDRLTVQLHGEALRKLKAFASASRGLDNQLGWSGIDSLNKRFIDLIDVPTEKIPDVIGLVYSAAIELGSFLELDRRLQSHSQTYAEPLDVEVRRPLEDLVKTMAPWVRRFPTARELDDETGQFLSQLPLIPQAQAAVNLAVEGQIIDKETAAVVRGLLHAASHGPNLGDKAGKRGVLSVRNLVVVAAGVSSFLLGAVSSDFATKSVLVQRAGTFLAAAEGPILELVADLPDDLRVALELLIKELSATPVVLPEVPSVPRRTKPTP
jgi:hypothetical protein